MKNYIILTPTEDVVVRILDKHKIGLSVSAISKEAGIARTSIYNAICALSQKNLVTRNGFIYSLHTQLCKKAPQAISASNQIHAFMEELLNLKKGEVIYSIESDEEIKELFKTPKEMLHWQKVIAKKKIVLKGIGTRNAIKILQTMASAELMKHISKRSGTARVTSEDLKATCTMVSFRGSVVFFSRKYNFYYRIDNIEVSKLVQSIFDMFYSYLECQKIA